MHVERLKHLVGLLRADAANPIGAKFDLGSWAGFDAGNSYLNHNFPLKGDLAVRLQDDHTAFNEVRAMKPEDAVLHAPTMSCDTFVCALGLAALDPEFNKQGLDFGVVPMAHSPTAWMIPKFGGVEGMEAGAAFFDISVDDSRYFFDPDCYSDKPTHAEGELFVAQRVEDFISGIVDESMHPAHRYEDDDGYDDDND